MNRDLFRRYVWLIDTIRHAEKLTYEEISSIWKDSPLNSGKAPLPLRTFHNHREAVENLFGIRILCDRSDGNRYYVAEDNDLEPTSLKVWMLQTLSVSNLINQNSHLEHRILVDFTPEEKFGLITVIDAMKHNYKLHIGYSIPTADNRTEFVVAPYCVRYWNSSWYLLGKCTDTGAMLVFDFSRVLHIESTHEVFEYEEDFSPADFFKNYYGMDIDPTLEPQKIRLKVWGKARDIIRTLPLHVSQKEILADIDSSVFEYFFVPSIDFKQTVLSMGSDAEVIAPLDLRRCLKSKILEMAEKYDTDSMTWLAN